MSETRAEYTTHRAVEAYQANRERVALLRWAAWALLGIALALEHGETPRQGLGEVIERLERVQATEGDDGRDAGGGHHSIA